jgi:hypothetical protein
MRRHCVLVAAHVAAASLALIPLPVLALKMPTRASEGSCRQAVNGLIALIDGKTDNTPLYRDTYAVLVNACGPTSPAVTPGRPQPTRDACHDLAAALVDLIEDGKMSTTAFVKARSDFAVACAPR